MLTRRSALLGTAAAMSVAAPVAMAEWRNRATILDAGLMELVRLFRQNYQTCQEAREIVGQARERADALPDCPEPGCPAGVWRAWALKHGLTALYDEYNDLSERCGDTANVVFATPAMT